MKYHPVLCDVMSSYAMSCDVSCCAPCSGSMIKELIDQGIDVTILWYNPNIQPKQVSTVPTCDVCLCAYIYIRVCVCVCV
jgi:Epoxyqueuosine reductase QueH